MLVVTAFQANVGLSADKGNLTSHQLQMGSSLRISRISKLLEMEGAQKYFTIFFVISYLSKRTTRKPPMTNSDIRQENAG